MMLSTGSLDYAELFGPAFENKNEDGLIVYFCLFFNTYFLYLKVALVKETKR